MDNLFAKIQLDLVESLKQKEEVKTSTLRLVISEVNNAKIKKGMDLEDEEILEVIKKEAKKRQESIAAFKQGERADLAEKEEKELAFSSKKLKGKEISVSKRIGITRSVNLQWRFFIKSNPFVSKR